MAKRSLSDSDCDDLFSDTKDSCLTSPGTDSCGHHVNRKKRRGIIEKRRRDRINNSLTELRRLVPTAFEKQGSAKLEKAEILQMTVDHLKMLHAKGIDALAYDTQRYSLDYHSLGFRECVSEVGRYLVTVEGMNAQDPLRQRLLSHLQCYVAQRELANKQASATSWGLNPLTPASTYPIASHPHLHHLNSTTGNLVGGPGSLQPTQHPSLMEASSPEQYILPNNPNHFHPSPNMSSNDSLLNHHHHLSHGTPTSQHNNSSSQLLSQHHNLSPSNSSMNSSHDRSLNSSSSSTGSYHHQMSPYGMSHLQNSNNNNNNNNNAGYVPNGKPYRPWGAEVAY